MTDKLLEITEKIYNEGVVKAKEEATKIIANSEEEAEKILSSAKKQADQILADAKKKVDEMEKKSHSEMQLAARQFTSNLKQKITTSISAPLISTPVKNSFSDIDFIKSIILTTIQNWNPQKPEEMDLNILLPEKDKKELLNFLEENIRKTLNKGVNIEFDPKIRNGFRIQPVNGNYTISFLENDFENFFIGYFNDKTRKLLFDSDIEG